MLNLIQSCGDYDKLYAGLQENYLSMKFKDTNMESVSKATSSVLLLKYYIKLISTLTVLTKLDFLHSELNDGIAVATADYCTRLTHL